MRILDETDAELRKRIQDPRPTLFARARARVRYWLGRTLDGLGLERSAVRHYARARALNPRAVPTLLREGRLRLRQGDAEALVPFRHALAQDPIVVERNGEALADLTRVYLRECMRLEDAGQRLEARAVLDELLALDSRAHAPAAAPRGRPPARGAPAHVRPRRPDELPRPERAARALARQGLRSLHVEVAPRGSSVTLELDGPDVLASCTCGDAPPCAHVVAALEALGAPSAVAAPSVTPAATPLPPLDCRTACRELVGAVVASGVDGAKNPEVQQALLRLHDALSVDFRPDARRAHFRLEDALEHRKLRKAAQALRRLDAVARSGGAPERRNDVTLLEVGRDTGIDRIGRWEETYFVDLSRGDLLVEAAPAVPGRETGVSPGPFPRLLLGHLVDIDPGPPPQRVRLMQYEPRGEPTAGDVDRLLGHAVANLEAVKQRAMQGESLVLARAARLGTLQSAPAIVDTEGRALPLASGARALTAALVNLALDGTLRAVLGRIGVGESRRLHIRPIAAVVDHRIVRLA